MLGSLDAKKQKELVFMLVVLAGAFFVSKKIWRAQEIQFGSIKKKIGTYQKQVSIAEKIQKLAKEVEQFNQSGWGSSNSVVIMGKINELARKYGVDILNVDPGQTRDFKYYSIFSMSMNIETSYFTFIRFLTELEQLPEFTKVTALQFRPIGKDTDEGPNINIAITLEAYCLKK